MGMPGQEWANMWPNSSVFILFIPRTFPQSFNEIWWTKIEICWKTFISGPINPTAPPTFAPSAQKKGNGIFFWKKNWPLFTPYCPLTSCKKSEKNNDSIFFKVPKTSFLGHFRPILGPFGPQTSCKKSEKTNDPIPRKTPDGRTDWRTDGRGRIHRTPIC